MQTSLECGESSSQKITKAWETLVLELEQNEEAQGTSLVAQWLRIRLPMQGTQVRVLVWEDPTCRRATKPMHHNY